MDELINLRSSKINLISSEIFSSIASIVPKPPGTVDQSLLAQSHQLPSMQKQCSFQSSNLDLYIFYRNLEQCSSHSSNLDVYNVNSVPHIVPTQIYTFFTGTLNSAPHIVQTQMYTMLTGTVSLIEFQPRCRQCLQEVFLIEFKSTMFTGTVLLLEFKHRFIQSLLKNCSF